jgi:hypothetical protein
MRRIAGIQNINHTIALPAQLLRMTMMYAMDAYSRRHMSRPARPAQVLMTNARSAAFNVYLIRITLELTRAMTA